VRGMVLRVVVCGVVRVVCRVLFLSCVCVWLVSCFVVMAIGRFPTRPPPATPYGHYNKTGVLTGETDWVRSLKLPAANHSRYEHPPMGFELLMVV